MSYLFARSGVQHILCCVLVLFFFVLLPVSLDCPFCLPLRHSLTFIETGKKHKELNKYLVCFILHFSFVILRALD